MQRLKFVNPRGQEALFDLEAPYIFWRIEGISTPQAQPVFTQAAGQDGYTFHSLVLEPRQVILTGHVHGNSPEGIRLMYEERKRLNAVLNPVYGPGTLYYENDFDMWQIPAFTIESAYLDKLRNVQTLNIMFECPSPYWQSVKQHEILLAYVDGGLRFPVKTPGYFGTLGYRAVIDNDSDGYVPVEMYVDGGSVNPVIINKTTGEFIKIERQFSSGDQIYINTDPEKMEVSRIYIDPATNKPVKENAYGYLSFDSTLLQLIPGENDLTFTSDDENKRVRVRIYFRKRYAGV